MHVILLQAMPTLAKSNTTSIIVGISILFIFILMLIVAGRSSSGRSGSGGPVKFSKRKFRKVAGGRGLSKGEINHLEAIYRRYRIQKPYQLLANSGILDSALKRAINSIEESQMTEQEKEAQKLSLYRIKQKIERSTKGVKPPGSTRTLRLGQNLSIAVAGVRYQSRVTSNLQKSLGLQIPTDQRGDQVRWKKWTKATIFFWRSNGQGFSFSTKVLGYNVVKGSTSLFVQHSTSIKEAQQRRYRRRELERPCYYYPITLIKSGVGKSATKKAMVETRRGTLGTILEVSAGGCSIRSTRPLVGGELIKVEFETVKGQKVIVLGKIRRMRKAEPRGGIMHVMFTRVSRHNLNQINEYVYTFDNRRETRSPRL